MSLISLYCSSFALVALAFIVITLITGAIHQRAFIQTGHLSLFDDFDCEDLEEEEEEEEEDAECPKLINRVGVDNENDDEREENKVDQTLMEGINKFMNMISGFHSRWKQDIFIDSTDEDDYINYKRNPTNSNIYPTNR